MQQMPSLQQMPAPEDNGHVHLVASELMAKHARGLRKTAAHEGVRAPEVNGHVHLVASELTAKHARGLRAAAATEGVHMKRRDACR